MSNDYNIVLITDESSIEELVLDKLILSRCNDKFITVNSKNYKDVLSKYDFSVILYHCTENVANSLKTIAKFKELQSDAGIILLLNDFNLEIILHAYDKGVYDYLMLDSEPVDYVIKTMNCIKTHDLACQRAVADAIYLENGFIDEKTGFYKQKFIKENFPTMLIKSDISRCVYVTLTLDESVRTKVSTNRLALAIQNCTRINDLKFTMRSGRFSIVLKNTNVDGAITVLNNIQDKMGENFKIRAGYVKLSHTLFDDIDKIANDSLISAIQKDVMYDCLYDSHTDDWLSTEGSTNTLKSFKLFDKVFKSKLNHVVSPIFYRFEKEFQQKLTNTVVNQYSNEVESVFCLKRGDFKSELVVRYDNHAKFIVEILHSGLDSEDNSKYLVPLKDMDDKYLSSLFKKLKTEYKKGIKQVKG